MSSIEGWVAILGVLLGLVSASRPARAADWGDRKLVVEGVTGLGTPVGLFGVLGRVDPVPWVSIGGGVGKSLGGVQYAGLVLGRVPFTARGRTLPALTLGASYSVGGSFDFDPNPTCWIEDCRNEWVHSSYHLANAHWVGLELGGEVRFEKGLSLRGFGGLAKITNPGSAVCKNYDQESNEWTRGPCRVRLPDAGPNISLFPDISGPPGMPDVIWVLGAAAGYAF